MRTETLVNERVFSDRLLSCPSASSGLCSWLTREDWPKEDARAPVTTTCTLELDAVQRVWATQVGNTSESTVRLRCDSRWHQATASSLHTLASTAFLVVSTATGAEDMSSVRNCCCTSKSAVSASEPRSAP